jgi:hypothetical protein
MTVGDLVMEVHIGQEYSRCGERAGLNQPAFLHPPHRGLETR